MDIFELRNRAMNSESGEYILGSQDTGSHACYLIYGVLKPGDKGRIIKPGSGHEEIVLAMKGHFMVTGYFSGEVKEGSAFHLAGEQECYLENLGNAEAVYIIAGGHSEAGSHQTS